MGRYLRYIFQLILSPAHGWEDIDAGSLRPLEMASAGFYPMTAVTAVSVFVGKLFHPLLTLQELLIDAIVTFMMFFLGYFFATFSLTTFLGSMTGSSASEARCQTFALFIIGLLELIAILGNVTPITMAIIWVLPIYAVIVMFKGREFLKVPEAKTGRFMLLAIPGVVLPPYILKYFFSLILK
ncbi:MAG: hypothetical protein HDS11_04890 [Bacteroides sp.]|nr:hypothetical protein [Bacteroides sp.]